MRKIKFRAWERVLGEMIPVNTIDFDKKIINTGGPWRFLEEVELMQFTGLKDKNGVEIYEGDIFFDDHNEEFGQVTFEEGKFLYETTTFVTDLFEIADALENRGNIYENPELIKSSIKE